MPTAKLDGLDLFYTDQGAGPPLIFLHGAGGSHANWANQVPVFSRAHRVIVPDQRGFGKSIPVDLRTLGDAPRLSQDLEDLIDLLGVHDDLFIVGHSLGTHPALDFTERHPGRVCGLVLSSSYGGLVSPAMAAGHAARLNILREAERRVGEMDGQGRTEGASVDEGVTGAGGGSESFIHTLMAVATRRSRPSLRDLRDYLETFRALDETASARIDVPVLILAGERDYTPAAEFEAAASQLPRAELAVLAGAAHAPHQERPEVFNDLLGRFFSRLG